MLIIECQPGINGGSNQSFHGAIYDTKTRSVVKNLLSSSRPHFTFEATYFTKNQYSLIIYASNKNGNSRAVMIDSSKIVPVPLQTGNQGNAIITNLILSLIYNFSSDQQINIYKHLP